MYVHHQMEFQFHHGHEETLIDSNTGFGINDEFHQNSLLSNTFLESSSYNFDNFCINIIDPQTLNFSSSYGHEHYINPPNPNYDYDYEYLYGVPDQDNHNNNINQNIKLESSALMIDEDYYSMFPLLGDDVLQENYWHDLVVNNQLDPQVITPCFEIEKGKGKKMMMMNTSSIVDHLQGRMGSGGQPSKNLMAERRRRKRLNDRLSMLRSIVPKITKMDRTSILGDTIDYMKELIQKINDMQQQQMDHTCTHQLSNAKPKEIFIRNSPKFEVERRRNNSTEVKISCRGEGEVLISTMRELEAFGLQINECVITCFNDFAMHASCRTSNSQESVIINSEDIKQALFRSAGYGGKCL